MDKKFVKKYGLNEDVKRFNTIVNYKSPKQSLKEYSFYIPEDDEQDQNTMQGQGMNGQNTQPDNGMGMGGQQGMQPMGNNQGMDMNQPPMDDGQGMGMNQPPMDNGQGMDMNQPPMDDGQGMDMNQPPMDDSQGMDMNQPPMDDGQGMDMEDIPMDDEEDEEVIDVDELTQSQEDTEDKVDVVDKRLKKLLSVIKELGKALSNNNKKIDDLQTEFEKRNPTEQEKLNIRSQSIGPFNQSPKDYWDNKKAADPRYNVIYNNDVSPSEEQNRYELRRSDLDGLDMRSIADTLNIDQKLEDYLKF